jgi:hypothetical protein
MKDGKLNRSAAFQNLNRYIAAVAPDLVIKACPSQLQLSQYDCVEKRW